MKVRHAVAALIFASALAGRAEAAEPSEVDRATARALTIEGYEALDRKDYAIAVDRFRRADALYHVPTVALGLAHAEVGLGKLVSALATYSGIVREGVPPKAPPAFTKAVDDAHRELDVLAARIPSVVITVGEAPGAPGLEVTIDGVEVPAAALGVKRPVDPGTHHVRAVATGFAATELTVNLLEGKTEAGTVNLKAETAPAPAPSPAPAPFTGVPLAAPPPSAIPPPLPPAPPPSTAQRTAGLALIGVGAAGLVVGGITGGLAVAKHASLTSTCPGGNCLVSQQAALEADVDTYHRLATTSTVGVIAGAAVLATGVVVVLTAPRAQPGREAFLAPVLGLGYLGATGSF
jgi:hypothetical protein